MKTGLKFKLVASYLLAGWLPLLIVGFYIFFDEPWGAISTFAVMGPIALLTGGLISLMAIMISQSISRQILMIAKKLLKGADEIASSSGSISKSSSELSEAATEQAASLQETVSSIDEISSMVQRNADAANSSTKVSGHSTEAAIRGKKTVETMMTSIHQISTSNDDIVKSVQNSNEEISKIVNVITEIGEKTNVINDIVFQTKLLSFNASVEAARAGEHGKGFAVVAEEVGNLASMSGKAALEITEMLDRSLKQVKGIVDSTKLSMDELVHVGKEKIDVGVRTAKECGSALDEILQNVSSVNDMVKEIATASREQATGVSEVTKAMQQLDETTHQNTSVAQQSSVMAQKLQYQADQLNAAIQELMSVISGEEPAKRVPKVQATNVIPFFDEKKKSNKTAVPPIANKKVVASKIKVAGSDVEVPSSEDPRFEDL